MTRPRLSSCIVLVAALTTPTFGGVVSPAQDLVITTPGQEVRVLWSVMDVSVPLFGYSLDLNRAHGLDAIGSVNASETLSNFFDTRNLITAGGASRDPFFSVIHSDGSGGLFISTNSSDGSAVAPVSGVNDVLAEIVFVVGADAAGDFLFELGLGSALSDIDGRPVAFEAAPLVIRVVPGPGALSIVMLSLPLCPTGRRRSR